MILLKTSIPLLPLVISTFALPYGYPPSVKHVSNAAALDMSLPIPHMHPVRQNVYTDLARRDTMTYTVVSGDTGYAIAARWSITFTALSAANPTVNWYKLFIGQALQMPSLRKPITYMTALGDTGNSVAEKYAILLSDLQAANPTVDFANLINPQQLQVPGYGTETTYSVASGDMGRFIAPGFGLLFPALSDANPGVNWNNLRIGQVLVVPAGQSPSQPNAAATTSTATLTSTAALTSAVSSTSTTTTTSTSVTSSTTTSTTSTVQPTTTATSTVNSADAVPIVNDEDSQVPAKDQYTFYTGNGSPSAGWPDMSSWASFDELWAANLPIIGTNCVGGVTPNTAAETQQVRNSIEAAAAASQIDHRFILAIMMQESNGCVRVPTTLSAIHNPGLMQDHDGLGTCNVDGGAGLMPCPEANILQMVTEGVMGTTSGDGLVQTINEAAAQNQADETQTYYMAARIYNSGSGGADFADLGAGGSTHCYVSDIANRLTGWVLAPRLCTLDGYQ